MIGQWLAHRAATADTAPERIRQQAESWSGRADEELARKAGRLSQKVQHLGTADCPEVLIPGAALFCEALRRTSGIRLYDVQLAGGLVLAGGQIAEMQTGEGKTLVAGLGAFLQGLTRRGVHVSTTNAYLAQRDFEGLAPVFQLLGLSAGLLRDGDRPAAARAAYQCDITYGTGYQFGFDYLRDQTVLRERSRSRLGDNVVRAIHGRHENSSFLRQRGFAMAIVDEADSVMIEEAAVPLVLSSRAGDAESERPYLLAQQLAVELTAQRDYQVDRRALRVVLLPPARATVHRWLRGRNVPALVRPWTKYVENALHANHLLERDEHYVVRDQQVQIVDQNTGRIFADRTWRDGLHQAVEAKEGLPVRPSDSSTARITRQRFFQLYDRVSGLTGTAQEAKDELHYFYQLRVVPLPTHQPCRRRRLRTRFFATTDAKLKAIVDSVQQHYDTRQPVLIGTRTIRQSRLVSRQLEARGVPHVVLNGTQDPSEAEIVRQAGQAGAVTVATNMAGRGTDIVPSSQALQLGGLHVIAAEQGESRRVDRQLAGRAARQGNPGSCQCFVSAEDDLIDQHDAQLARRLRRSADQQGECREDFSADIDRLQSRVERLQFENRKKLVQSDAWFDSVRETLN